MHAFAILSFVKQRQYTEYLYHYTDLNGLKGIVTEHDLWLTNALYSNDEAETKLGINVARDQIKSMLKSRTQNVPSDYLQALDDLLLQPREGVYLCCFCESDDKLSQWRAYGGNWNGVSIYP